MRFFVSLMVLGAAVASFAQCGGCSSKKGPEAFDARDREFLAMAEAMKSAEERGLMGSCCKSKSVAKAGKGCCNAPGQEAKFKVFVANAGYRFYGCQGSASQGRQVLLALGERVGTVQRVTANNSIR